MTKTVSVDDVQFDPKIWPRARHDSTAIKRYAAAMQNGDAFPPIVLETSTMRLLDGYHRWKAARLAGVKTLDAVFVDLPKDEPAVYHSGVLNAHHGTPLTFAELRAIAREMVAFHLKENDERGIQVRVAKDLSVAQNTVSDWTHDLYVHQDKDLNRQIQELRKAGKTQVEIGAAVGLDQTNVARRLKAAEAPDRLNLTKEQIASITTALLTGENMRNIAGDISHISVLLEEFTPHDIAEREGIPERLLWAVANKNVPDIETMQALGFSIRPYDVWNIAESDNRFGTDGYPGRIPALLIANALFFFTKKGDLVLDPMGGGGTTGDVCLAMNRRCIEFDIAPQAGRPEIFKADVSKGIPSPPKGVKAKLIFWDPPYFNKMAYAKGGISHLSRADYLRSFSVVAKSAKQWLTKDGHIALLMSDFIGTIGKPSDDDIWIWDYIDLFKKAGYRVDHRISCPLSNQQIQPFQLIRNIEARKLAILSRDLILFSLKE